MKLFKKIIGYTILLSILPISIGTINFITGDSGPFIKDVAISYALEFSALLFLYIIFFAVNLIFQNETTPPSN